MSHYAIGDIQGCADGLHRLLDKLNFDPADDTLWFCGDLVNRGGKSLEALRTIYGLRKNVKAVLGNHDLSLLAYAEGLRKNKSANAEFKAICAADDGQKLLKWLRKRPLMAMDTDLEIAMVHAGRHPRWSRKKARRLAREVEAELAGDNYRKLLAKMYGNTPDHWEDDLKGYDRLRVLINTFTRMRYIDKNYAIDSKHKGNIGTQPKRLMPWFSHPNFKVWSGITVMGHWSTLGFHRENGVTALDTGFVWGGKLTAIDLLDSANKIQVKAK